MNLGKAIKWARVARELSQMELAELTGLSVSYLSLLERNKRDPVLSTITKIADALDVSVVLLVYVASNEDEREPLPRDLQASLSHEVLEALGV